MKKFGNENTALTLTDKAFKAYSETDPLAIWEEETEDGYRYTLTGCIEDEDLTAEEVNEALEEWADEMDDMVQLGETYEDPEGIWEITAIDDDQVTVKCIQEENPNYGEEFIVEKQEAYYFLQKR